MRTSHFAAIVIDGCRPQTVVPLERNGQTVNLHQRKFHVSIPFVYSTAGYGFLFNMPGAGSVAVGKVRLSSSIQAFCCAC